MSGESMLMSTTEAQIDATVAPFQASHEFATACHRTAMGGGHPPGVPAGVDGVNVVSHGTRMPRQYEASSRV